MPLPKTLLSTPFGDIALSDTSGAGLPIVMLHGVGASRDVFARQFESPLSAAYRLIAIDLPGHGASSDCPEPDAGYTLPALADLIAHVLGRLGVARALIVGWSMGGHIAIEMMSRSPQLFAGAMICGAAPIGRGPLAMLRGFHANWDLLLASKAAFTPRDAVRFARLCFGAHADEHHIASILRADGRMRPRANRSLMRGDSADQKRVVETCPVPLAMVNGADEPVVRLGYIGGLAYADLWEDTCHQIPGAGHAPFFTAPHTFNVLLQRFAADMDLRERYNRGSRIAHSA